MPRPKKLTSMDITLLELELDQWYKKLGKLLRSIRKEAAKGEWTYEGSVEFLNKLNLAQQILKRYTKTNKSAIDAHEGMEIIKQELLSMIESIEQEDNGVRH